MAVDRLSSAINVFLLLSTGLRSVSACTTIVAGKKATVDGSVLCSHSNDGDGNTDPRLVLVPAQDHPEGAMRPVFFTPETYPRYVGTERGVPAYYPVGNQTAFVKIGEIPQVSHTYQYYEQTYGAMNEHQVGIGESTCSGIFGTKAAGHGGVALMSMDTLTYLAMERCRSSRCAVQLMGDMAVRYGFYGANSFEGTAESVMVTDPNEAFIFHILPDNTNASAIWVAQRVPDDHIGVVANAFMIRDVDLSDSFTFLASPNLHSIAQSLGKWQPGQPFDFTAIYSAGEYDHKFYSGRRVWGAYNLLAHEQGFSPDYAEWRRSRPYPATTVPDRPVSVQDLMHVHRSYYQGTQFDQTKGVGAGPYGTPDHVYAGSHSIKGNWERTIAIYRTTDSYVVQARSWLPDSKGGVLWWGAHAAPYTQYVPLGAGMGSLPGATLGHQAAFDRATFFHANRYIATLAQVKWKYIMEEVASLQAALMKSSMEVQAAVDADSTPSAESALTDMYIANADFILESTWSAFERLMMKYADGYITTLDDATPNNPLRVAAPDVPAAWLKAVGYEQGPPPLPTKLTWKGAAIDHHQGCATLEMKGCIESCARQVLDRQYRGCVNHCISTC